MLSEIGADQSVPTITLPPAGDNSEIGTARKAPRRRRAEVAPTAMHATPSVAPTESGGRIADDSQCAAAPSETEANVVPTTMTAVPPSPTIAALVELQRQRVFCIKSQSRCDRSAEAFVARYLGYRTDLPEKERKAIFNRAAAMRKQVEKGGVTSVEDQRSRAPEADGEGQHLVANQTAHALSACAPIILNSATARHAWDVHRTQVEKRMRQLARTLPVYEWVNSIAGFGDLGLAIIVGEVGDIGTYATKERLWKRCGLAVIEGERQQRRSDPEEAKAHGYNPRRRAEIWTLADSMFRHQWRGEKDGVAPHAIGPYGEIYARRKAHTETREWTMGRRDNDARRVMTKVLLEDLWRVWRGATCNPVTVYAAPHATPGQAHA